MKILLFLLLVVHMTTCCYSQSFSSHKIAVTPVEEPEIEYDEMGYRNAMRTRYFDRFKRKDQFTEFVEMNALAQRELLTSSFVYSNWPECENYLRGLFIETVSSTSPDTAVNVFLVRDESVNAAMYENGTVIINVGLLASVDSEAELAAVLGHEYGHFSSEHAYHRYKQFIKSKKTARSIPLGGLLGLGARAIVKSSLASKLKKMETEADKKAVEFIHARGYDPNAMVITFSRFEAIDQKFQSRNDIKTRFQYIKTHPSDRSRIRQSKKLFTELNCQSGKQFFYDSLLFSSLKKQAVDECIYLSFEKRDYAACVEKSFQQHLYHPDDEFYLFYLAESLKRLIGSNPATAEKYFITWRYNLPSAHDGKEIKTPDTIFTSLNDRKKIRYANSVFYHYEDFIYNFKKEDLPNIKAQNLTDVDTMEFITNNDALRYFKSKLNNNCAAHGLCLYPSQKYFAPSQEHAITEPERKYAEVHRNLDSIRANLSTLNKAYVSLPWISVSSATGGSYNKLDLMMDHDLKSAYHDYFYFRSSDSILYHSDLAFDDRRQLSFAITHLWNISEKKGVGQLWEIEPELFALAAKTGVNKFIISELSILKDRKFVPGYARIGDIGRDKRCDYTILLVDLENNRISKFKDYVTSNQASYDWLFKELEKSFQKVLTAKG